MYAFESTGGEGGTIPELNREQGLYSKPPFPAAGGESGTAFEMKREKGLDAKNFFLDQSTGGGSGTIPEMKSEKQFPAPSLYPRKFLLDLGMGGASAAIGRTVSLPTDTFLHLFKQQGAVNIVRWSSLASIYWGPGSTGVIARFVPMQALSYTFKECMKNEIEKFLNFKRIGKQNEYSKNILSNFVAGGLGGLMALEFLYPFDYARARLGTDVGRAGYMDKGLGDCMIKIAKTEGPLALYRGFTQNMPTVFAYHACFFGIHDTAKMMWTANGREFDGLACLASASMAWFGAITVSNILWKIKDESLKQLKLKDVLFKGSLTGAYRSSGLSSALFLLVLEAMRND